MRVVAIGLGGAGCRIVDKLYATDRRSSKVACVQSLAIDVDEATLKQLGGLPEKGKVFFPAINMETNAEESGPGSHTATIDIGEIVSRVQNFESGETDAIIICCGLGGSMVDVAPHIITALRSSVVEPIFGLVTLPCLAEGERRSSKAADDIDMLQSLLDGIILFDNETWYKKIIADKAHLKTREKGFAEKMGLKKGEQEFSPAQATYALLNEGIVRRISLILRAGEFKADGGIDLAEVVLDSGEVLNTMKGMGFITIGYAVERLPSDPFSFLSKLKPASIFDEEQKKKASRIVELAKQAIYHEVSTPCDMTSAHKALILIAGPSHELSMKGFMTVRKWIDRSIAGLETRSGDYPVMNTKNVAIIIMLSGLENIPRITEIREIRTHYNANRQSGQNRVRDQFDSTERTRIEDRFEEKDDFFKQDAGSIKDEMIILPVRQRSENITTRQSPESSTPSRKQPYGKSQEISDNEFAENTHGPMKKPSVEGENQELSPQIRGKPHSHEFLSSSHTPEKREGGSTSQIASKSQRVIITNATEENSTVTKKPDHHPDHMPIGHVKSNNEHHQVANHEKPLQSNRPEDAGTRSRDLERQLIVRELQRQRVIAISGHTSKSAPGSRSQPDFPKTQESRQILSKNSKIVKDVEPPSPAGSAEELPVRTRVLITKKRERSSHTDGDRDKPLEESIVPDVDATEIDNPPEIMNVKDRDIKIKEPAFKAKDDIFEGKMVKKTLTPLARDSGLLHTNIKSKKAADVISKTDERSQTEEKMDSDTDSPQSSDKKNSKHDDISWV
jgi:tubulin-like protein CetZ